MGRKKEFGGAFSAEGFTRAGIEFPGDVVKLLLRVDREVGAFGKILAKKAIGIFVNTAFPGAVGPSTMVLVVQSQDPRGGNIFRGTFIAVNLII